ncbi:VanZ family protein [Kibdelosporangium philippinense]|uniref:VanZ family protein n=1 Tax=Kibdelosporangium philippinense TaxID=211113 RepID=A0ABS8ZAG3_9PSEU|nr:VanZ family protein [Kibdelosporangium philippinense]MCE7004790.1 VanZ family protein [Kibdelosporangium philippinense]
MSAVIAIVGGCFLAVLLSLPFVVVSYRRRGELGFGRILLAVGFVIYALAIMTYTLLPLPQINETWCLQHQALTSPQLNVMQFLTDIRHEQRGTGVMAYLHNPAVQQTVFNIFLFVPLGAFLKQFFGRSAASTIVIGFGVSLLVEFTQLTGNWFLFPCPYRLFDVDDLITNTLGTAVGVAIAPILRPLAGRKPTAPPTAARPVTAWRRLLGMMLDLVSVYLFGTFLFGTINVVSRYVFNGPMIQDLWITSVFIQWVPVFLLLVLPSLGKDAGTIGQRAVRLARVRPDGRPAGARIVIALLTGGTGYFICMGLIPQIPVLGFVAFVLAAGAFVLVWPRSHRGLSGVLARLSIVDSRERHREDGYTADRPATDRHETHTP